MQEEVAIVDFEYAGGDRIEQMAVVGYAEQAASIASMSR